jgi:DNA replication protein DnaC
LEDKNKFGYFKHVFVETMIESGYELCDSFPVNNIVKDIVSVNIDKYYPGYMIRKLIEYAIQLKLNKCNDDKILNKNDFEFIKKFRCNNVRKQTGHKYKNASDYLDSKLMGLNKVKKEIIRIVNIMKFNKERAKKGVNTGYHNVHVMLGPPGTAKTTIAGLMGKIMSEEKLLNGDKFIAINGADLKGQYVGQTAPKIKELFQNNDIIFIDEAYSITGSDPNRTDPYSEDAISQLLIELENHSQDRLVIFAGYGGTGVKEKDNRMKTFLASNPGLRSRITNTIVFPRYTVNEMIGIVNHIAKAKSYKIEDGCEEILRSYFTERIKDSNFANGREARVLLETCETYIADRLLGSGKKKCHN